MIFTYSVLKGLQATLGLAPLRIALFAAIFLVPIPSKDDLAIYSIDKENLAHMWGCQSAIHLFTAILSLLSFTISLLKQLEFIVSILQTITTMLMILVYMWQF